MNRFLILLVSLWSATSFAQSQPAAAPAQQQVAPPQAVRDFLGRPHEWLAGDIDDLHNRVLATYQSFRWPAEERARALQMREAIMNFMMDRYHTLGRNRRQEQAVSYLVHYMNIDHTQDREPVDGQAQFISGQPSLGFIPASIRAKAHQFVAAQAPNLSRAELARVVARDSLPRTASARQIAYPREITQRIEAEQDPRFVVETLRAMDEFVPVEQPDARNQHPAFALLLPRVAGMNAEQITSLLRNPPQVFKDAEAEKNQAVVDTIRVRMIAQLGNFARESEDARRFLVAGVEDFLPSNATETLYPDIGTAIERYAANAPVNALGALIEKLEAGRGASPAAIEAFFNGFGTRSTADLAPVFASDLPQAYKDFALQKIRERSDREGPAPLAAAVTTYFSSLPANRPASSEAQAALRSHLARADIASITGLVGSTQNPQAQAILREHARTLGQNPRLAVYRQVAAMREIPARDALNAEIAKWKSDAIALVNRGEGIDEKDRRDILFAVVDSTLLAEHSYLRAAGADALTALSDRIRRQRLPSDNAYLPLFERIIEQDFDANDLAAANRHYAAIQAYRNLAGDAAARAFLAERLGRARQANNNDARLINIYAGLRAISSPTAAESQALTEAREPVRTRLNSINRGQQRARSLSFALRLFDAGATEFNAEVGKSFNDMLRFDMGANQPKERLEQNMEVISQICLRPNVVQDFSHIRQACGFPGGPEIRQVVMGQAIQSLQPIVASGRDESLARRAENLIQELENRAESLESSLAQQQTNPVARALANLPFLICLKPDRTTAQIQRQDLALLDDAARSRLCREQNLGEYLDPARGVIRENRDGEQAPAPAPSQLPAPAPARPVQEAT